MGIELKTKTKKKASLKLFNQINSFLFEQEYDELKGNSEVKKALTDASNALKKLINSN